MKKLSDSEVIARFTAKHGSRYDYSKVVFINTSTKVEIVCQVHGEFWQTPYLHMSGGGCPVCGGNRLSKDEPFIVKCKKVHGDKYDYTKTVYTRMHDKVWITCPEHGDFLQKAYYHVQGSGCPVCAGVARHTTDSFVAKARKVHGDLYDYTNTVFEHNKKKVRIDCKKHGPFYQTPNMHLHPQGCPKCARDRIVASVSYTVSDFVTRAREVHGDKYEYSKVTSYASKDVLTIGCKIHGDFEQVGYYHLAGNGCQKCGNVESKGESEVAEYIRSLTTYEVITRDRTVLGPYELDCYVPELKLAIEFCGSYFHSDYVRDFGKNRHYDKYAACAKLGIRLITIYDTEWETKQHIVKKVLRTAVGQVDSRRFARKLKIIELDFKSAKVFFSENHLQGSPSRGIFYALIDGGKPVACMAFAKGASIRGNTSCWELLRYASEGQVIGGASRLFSEFVRKNKPEKVVSFSDNRWFTGGMYETLGFELEETLKPDYSVWSNKTKKMYHKSLLQRSSIPSRIAEFGYPIEFDPKTDPRSEREMTKLLNCGRIYDCGKKRWVWTQKLAPTPKI